MNVWIKIDCTQGLLQILSRPMQYAYEVICVEWDEDVFITSITEGKHLAWSRHYFCDAIDVFPPLTDRKVKVRKVRDILGTDYEVIDESNHIHVGYDPK